MRALTAAIITVSGLFCFTLTSFISHNDTQSFVMLVTGAVGLIGLIVWGRIVLNSSDPPAP